MIKNKSLNVAVVGGGTTGPAAALLLKRKGHSVTVFERVAKISPVGAGVLVQPTGLEVLRRLNLLSPIQAHRAPVSRLHSENHRGKVFLHLNYSELAPGLQGWGLHRAVLCKYLFDAMEEEKIPVNLGTSMSQIDWKGNQSDLIDSDENRHGPFDLVILSDGSRSTLRDQTPLVRRSPRYPWGALWFIGKNSEGHFSDTLFQVVKGTRKMVGFLPTGLDLHGRDPLVSLFWSIKESEREACLRRGLGAWKKEVLELVPQSSFLLDQIQSFDQLTFAAYYDVVMKDWHYRNIVILGDSAHAMSPQLGQGVNLGFFDAMVLSDCIEAAPTLPEAFREYSRKRRRHLGFYQFATRWATPFFQSSTPGLGLLRDYGFALLNAVPVLRRQMIRSMAGLKRGFLRRSLSYFEPPAVSGAEKGP